MKKQASSTVDVQDIIEVVEHNNFSTEMQIFLLEILNLALYEKQYPNDTCGILDRKYNFLKNL
jgi:hypothetical protein